MAVAPTNCESHWALVRASYCTCKALQHPTNPNTPLVAFSLYGEQCKLIESSGETIGSLITEYSERPCIFLESKHNTYLRSDTAVPLSMTTLPGAQLI